MVNFVIPVPERLPWKLDAVLWFVVACGGPCSLGSAGGNPAPIQRHWGLGVLPLRASRGMSAQSSG
eukprot:3249298-Pyramimonas_sp.AAC.1